MSITKARKLKIVRSSNRPLRLEPCDAVHVGVDVHKASYSVALYSPERGLLDTWVQPALPELLLERLRPLREGIAQVVYEAGPTGFSLARRLRVAGYEARVIAPSKLLAPVGPEAKSDRLDCRRLAQFSAKGLLHPVRVPTEQEEADRQVLRLREQLVAKTRAVQAQIKSFLLQHGIAEPAGLGHWSKKSIAVLRGLTLLPELRFCLDLLLDELAHAQEQVRRVTVRLKGTGRGRPAPRGDKGAVLRPGDRCADSVVLPAGASRAPAIRPPGPGGADGRAGPAGPSER
jgi:transposase